MAVAPVSRETKLPAGNVLPAGATAYFSTRYGTSSGRAVFCRFRTVFHPFIDRFLRFFTVFTVFRKRLKNSQKCKAFPALDRLLMRAAQ
jgi:hypothetical protein